MINKLKKFFSIFRLRLAEIGQTNRTVNSHAFFIRRIQLENNILHYSEEGVSSVQYCSHEIIVSLTSYGRRLYEVAYTIESLMEQTLKANRIVLWIDEKLMDSPLPISLTLLQKRGLTIKYTKDIRSYTKLIPSLKEYPESVLITVDDDVLYDYDILERLVKAYIADPYNIHACRVHGMTFNTYGELESYEKWDWRTGSSHKNNFLTGVGGVLYPPNSLSPEVLNEEVFTSICPSADDVWFTAMALLNGTKIKKVSTRSLTGEDYINNDAVQDMGLNLINVGTNGQNNLQIKAVFSRYNIYNLLNR